MAYLKKADYIYQLLKDNIIDGKLTAGERIVVSDIAKKHQVSPMPVREAITKLEKYGYVEMIPHIGAKVATMDYKKFKEIILIRMEIEPLAAKLAVPYISNETIVELDKIIKGMEKAVKDKNKELYENLNKDFHLKIYLSSPYSYINELILELWQKSEFSRVIFKKISDRLENSLEEHRQWLDAIKNRDAEEAEKITRKHKKNAFKELFGLIDANEV